MKMREVVLSLSGTLLLTIAACGSTGAPAEESPSPTVIVGPALDAPPACADVPAGAQLVYAPAHGDDEACVSTVALSSLPSNEYVDLACVGYFVVAITGTEGAVFELDLGWGEPLPGAAAACAEVRARGTLFGHDEGGWELLGSMAVAGGWNGVSCGLSTVGASGMPYAVDSIYDEVRVAVVAYLQSGSAADAPVRGYGTPSGGVLSCPVD